jgi:hypothetical protein
MNESRHRPFSAGEATHYASLGKSEKNQRGTTDRAAKAKTLAVSCGYLDWKNATRAGPASHPPRGRSRTMAHRVLLANTRSLASTWPSRYVTRTADANHFVAAIQRLLDHASSQLPRDPDEVNRHRVLLR